jgi:predicted alpha/beta superfamily hydrolase
MLMNKLVTKGLVIGVMVVALCLNFYSCAWLPGKRTVEKFSLQSVHSGYNYQIQVSLPIDYDINLQDYPLAIVLDGDVLPYVSNQVETLEQQGHVQTMVLVGLGYGKIPNTRTSDYTPTLGVYRDENGTPGMADAFLAMIKHELLPLLEQRYRIAPEREKRGIFGHSLGGLLVSYAMCTQPELFGRYCAASASLWWDGGVIFSLAAPKLWQALNTTTQYFMAYTQGEGSDVALYGEEFAAWLKANAGEEIIVDTLVLHSGQHTSSWQHLYPEGFKTLFPGVRE